MEPDKVLRRYLIEKCAWEAECARLDGERIAGRMDVSECDQIAVDKYRPIFARFCSEARALPRQSVIAYTTPLDDPEAEKTIATRMLSVAEIETQQVAGHRKRHLYRLVLEEGQWRLFEKFIIATDGEMIQDEL